jgi:hypothetical protein
MSTRLAPTRVRVCAINGCGRRIAQSVVMCREHWLKVPQPLRVNILNARGLQQRATAIREAIRFVNAEAAT